jgi:DNA polymerase III delta prime subunit
MSEYINWTEKYCPKTYKEYIGGSVIIKQIKEWFQNFKINPSSVKKALLFHGPCAVGKTALAHIALKEAGYKTVEYNCQNITDIKDVRDNVRKTLGHANILDLFQGNMKPSGVIIDEIDNITNGMTELVNMLKSDEMVNAPVIFTCNNLSIKGLKTLRTCCLEIKFNKPTKFEMEQLITHICSKEGFSIDLDAYFLILEQSQFDWRRLIGIIEEIRARFPKDDVIDLDKVKLGIAHLEKKDIDYQLSEIVNRTFNKLMDSEECYDIFLLDTAMIPLYIVENYPKAVLARKIDDSDAISKLAQISKNMVQYDVITTDLYQTQDWTINSYSGIYALNSPNFIINYKNNIPAQFLGMSASSLLNKMSQYRRNLKSNKSLGMTLETNLSYKDLYIISEWLIYNLFNPKGKIDLVIPLLMNIGINLWDDIKNEFMIDPINDIINLNNIKNKKITAKIKTELKNNYKNYTISKSNSNSNSKPYPESETLSDTLPDFLSDTLSYSSSSSSSSSLE